MGFGGFGAPGMGFGAAAQGSNYNHVNQSATQGPARGHHITEKINRKNK